MGKRRVVAVIGGGSVGFTAARRAAALGARVLLFMGDNADRASLCVNDGCMPSKALYGPIDEVERVRRRGWFPLRSGHPARSLRRLVAWKDREIARFRAYRQAAIAAHESDDFVVVRQNARFVDPHTLESGGRRYRADAFVVATGSRPFIPPVEGIESLRDAIWTNEEILRNVEIPESLAVVGGGANGLEFAQHYARLGARVTLLSRSRLLPRHDPEFGERLASILDREGLRVLTGYTLTAARRDPDGFVVLDAAGPDGDVERIATRRVLLATGRRPAIGDLDLPAAGVSLDDGGRFSVGDDLRVAGRPHIFSAGDVNGRRMVVHHAHIEAGIAAENAVRDGDRKWARRARLQVVFTDPEFACAGLSVDEAKEAGHPVVTASRESRLVGKLHLAGDDHGFGRFVADAKTHRLLGAGLLCDGAGNLIHLPAYAIDHEHTVHQLAAAEYYHPTRIEIVSGIADRLCLELGGAPYSRPDE